MMPITFWASLDPCENAKAQAPDLALASEIDPGLNTVDGLLSQTVYRVIQEAVTNVLRHAKANAMHVAADINGREVIVEVSDDGTGFPADRMFGRGLTGMLERARALSGTLELLREERGAVQIENRQIERARAIQRLSGDRNGQRTRLVHQQLRQQLGIRASRVSVPQRSGSGRQKRVRAE